MNWLNKWESGGNGVRNIYNFKLSRVFHENKKEYVTRPIVFAKYQPEMENGWMVYFMNITTKVRGVMMNEGMKFFPTEAYSV